jgi:hypothetical protein
MARSWVAPSRARASAASMAAVMRAEMSASLWVHSCWRDAVSPTKLTRPGMRQA